MSEIFFALRSFQGLIFPLSQLWKVTDYALQDYYTKRRQESYEITTEQLQNIFGKSNNKILANFTGKENRKVSFLKNRHIRHLADNYV